MLVTDLKFQKNFFYAMIILLLNGAHPHVPRNGFWRARTFLLMAVMGFGFYLLINAAFNHDLPNGKYSDACQNITMLLVGISTTIKFWFLHFNRELIADIFEIIDEDYEQSKAYSEEEKCIVVKYAQKGMAITKFCLLNFVNGVLFLLQAFVLMAYYRWKGEPRLVHMFDLAVPGQFNDRKYEPLIFCSLFAYTTMYGTYNSTMNSAFEPLVPIILTHLSGQLQICSNRINKLFIVRRDSQDIYQDIKWINMKLKKLYSITDEINAIFGPLYELILKTNMLLVPLTAFEILQDFLYDTLKVEFILFLAVATLHSYVPCEYSDILLEHSTKFRQAIYFCGWEKNPDKKIRASIIIMLIRTNKTMQLNSVFLPLCRDTFATVCRHSYTIFNLIYAAWM